MQFRLWNFWSRLIVAPGHCDKKLTGGDGSVSLGKRIVVAADVGLAAAVSDAVVVSRSSSSCLL